MNLKNGFGVYFTNDIIYIGNYENDKKMDLAFIFGGKKMKLLLVFLRMGNNMNLENIYLKIKIRNMEFGALKIIIIKLNGFRILKIFIKF